MRAVETPLLALAREALPDPCPACGCTLASVVGPAGDVTVGVPQPIRCAALVEIRWHPCAGPLECPGHGRGGTAEPCCDRAGRYNGYGSDGPRLFRCPKQCSCHD